MTFNNAQIVADFLRAFMSGKIEEASNMVREDFSFRAPMHQRRGNKAAYFAGAAEKAKFIRAFRILHQWTDGNQVSTIYELDIQTPEDAGTVAMSEWHTVNAGQVASTFMIFDSSARAVHLLRNALTRH